MRHSLIAHRKGVRLLGLLLAEGFRHAVASLAERILDELFIITDFPFASGLWAMPNSPEFGICWFRPLYPERRLRPLSTSVREGLLHPLTGEEQMLRDMIVYTPVGSLRPQDLGGQVRLPDAAGLSAQWSAAAGTCPDVCTGTAHPLLLDIPCTLYPR